MPRKRKLSFSQSVFLFNGSIEDNIKYGRPDATHEEVVLAAKAAGDSLPSLAIGKTYEPSALKEAYEEKYKRFLRYI